VVGRQGAGAVVGVVVGVVAGAAAGVDVHFGCYGRLVSVSAHLKCLL
jgi:hypothetical protein